MSATRLKIALRPSRRLVIVLAGGHLAAALAALTIDVSSWVKFAMIGALAVNAGYQIARVALLRTPASIVALEIDRDGVAAVAMRDGVWHEAVLLGTSFVSPVLIVLNVRLAGARAMRHVVMMADSADGETLRALRVLLRWGLRLTV